MRGVPSRVFLVVLLLLASLATISIPVSGGNSGGVEASEGSVYFLPEEPVMGGSITITMPLYNSNPTTAFDVEYGFYKNSISTQTEISWGTVDIPGESYVDVTGIWNYLPEGEQDIWFHMAHGGDNPVRFSKSVNVSGLANLEVTQIDIDALGLRIGDTAQVSTTISNTGTVDAGNSTLQVGIQGDTSSLVDVSVPPITAGNSVIVNSSLLFPNSGTWNVIATPDAYDVVSEVSEGYGENSVAIEVLPMPDYHFSGALSITSPTESLDGPWTISGMMNRSYGSGNETVQIGFSVGVQGSQVAPVIAPLEVIMTGDGETSEQFSLELDDELQGLDAGEYALTATIDPFGFVNQSDTSNDQIVGLLNIRPIPNVQVDPASPSSMTVNSGDKVNWYVLLTNTGDITVSGRLNYSWEGQINQMSPVINIDPFSSTAWEVNLSTAQGAHTATFSAKWEPLSNSYDSVLTDSDTTVSITVSDTLSLTFQANTGALTANTENGAPEHAPLRYGSTYAYTISLTSSGEGNETLVCLDGDDNELSSTSVSITTGVGAKVTCIFKVEQTIPFNIKIVAEDGSAQTHSRTWIVNSADSGIEVDDQSFGGLVTIIGFGALALFGILVAALILTREIEEEVERDIFDYCPACDGELDGDEDICPHCSFNLRKARKKFHDCPTCNENIPSMISHCPFCGTEQDVSSHFESRERKEIKALPEEEEEEEEEDDSDVVVTGTEDFDTAIEEFGYDAEQLESDWDENFAAAEAEMEALEARIEAEEEFEEEEGDVAEPLLAATADSFTGEGLDTILEGKEGLVAVEDKGDDSEELSASDAEIRKQLFDITGEEGVLPGEEVVIGMGLSDRGLAGNEVPEEAMDFSFEDDELTPQSVKQRRAVRRRKSAEEMGECGACGAEIPMNAEECSTCGARFT